MLPKEEHWKRRKIKKIVLFITQRGVFSQPSLEIHACKPLLQITKVIGKWNTAAI